MKYFAFLALIGLSQQISFRPNPKQSPWAVDPDAPATTKITGAYLVKDKLSDYYNRVVPENFSADKDDLLMRSVIQNYAVEGKLADGSGPNGQFYLTRAAAEEVGRAVVQQHFGWTGEKNSGFVKSRLEKLWPHIDVLNEGFIDVEKSSSLLRQLLGEVEIENQLQVQLSDNVLEGNLVQFRPDPVKSPWSAPPAAPGPSGKIAGAYTKQDQVTTYYERNIPSNFASGSDDLLMRNLITNYALEGKSDGSPNQHFYLTKDAIQTESKNVVREHFGWDDKKTADYVQKQLTKLYPYYDVLNEGFLDVQRVPVLLRQVLGEVEIDNRLQ